MFSVEKGFSSVSMVLPSARTPAVVDVLTQLKLGAFGWKARGTLLQDHWYKRFLPPVSPSKTMLHALVPDHQVNQVVDLLVQCGNLDKQANGAIFASRSERTFIGKGFVQQHALEELPSNAQSQSAEGLSAIFCVVEHRYGERVAKAAINAGAHGPIVYYSEGRGIRDRLGWLRITKETEKEVVMVLADEADVESIFDAMALAADIHLPGRGFMYRLPVERGLFNLPSRISHHHYEANMQQIIQAIDHLAGHSHWRDQVVLDVGLSGRGAGLKVAQHPGLQRDQACLSAVVSGDAAQTLMDMLLDSGAPGVNIHRGSFLTSATEGARIGQDYALMRCVSKPKLIQSLCEMIDTEAESAGITDLAVLTHSVPRIATYFPGKKDYRKLDSAA